MRILNCKSINCTAINLVSILLIDVFWMVQWFWVCSILKARVVCFQGPVFLRVQAYPCNRQESRALSFSEEKTHWQLPMNDVNIVCDVTTKDGMSPTLAMLTALARFFSCIDKMKK